MKRYLIALLAALALIAASVATQAHTTEGTIPTLEQFRTDRIAIRQRADHIKADVKCRGHVHPFVHTAGYFDRQRRPGVLRYWRGVVVNSRALKDNCFASRMWAWFNTSGAACVKAHEGSWSSDTGNSYYGGFQADLDFQRKYGAEYLSRWGTANNWAPVYQIHMAFRGWSARGWSPWPNTARMCGLI